MHDHDREDARPGLPVSSRQRSLRFDAGSDRAAAPKGPPRAGASADATGATNPATRSDSPAALDGFDERAVDLLFTLARRHEENFSVVAVHAAFASAKTESAPRAGREAAAAALREAIGAASRRSDIVLDEGAHGYSICCPRTDRAGASLLAERLQERCTAIDGCRVESGVASFPGDALTLESLKGAAHAAALQRSRADRGGSSGGVGPGGRRASGDRKKRIFDLVAVILAAPLWLPLLAIIGLAVFGSDPRSPVIFKQTRTGRGGRRFAMYKFRTMVADAEEQKASLRHLNERQWPDFKISNDPRITAVGRILRRTSLDELPQLFNVLKGEMSLVGPRPTSFAPETYRPWHTARLDVRPGLTGLWQVGGRATRDFDERLRLDIRYIDDQHWWSDLALIGRTLWVVISGRGAQ